MARRGERSCACKGKETHEKCWGVGVGVKQNRRFGKTKEHSRTWLANHENDLSLHLLGVFRKKKRPLKNAGGLIGSQKRRV